MVVADADLFFGAAHTVAHLSHEGARGDLDLTDLRADLGESGLHTDAHVGSAADDVNEFILADIHLQKMELFAFGMRLDGLDLGDHDAAEVAALELNIVFDLGCRERELVDQAQLVESGKVYKILDPIH